MNNYLIVQMVTLLENLQFRKNDISDEFYKNDDFNHYTITLLLVQYIKYFIFSHKSLCTELILGDRV